MKRVYITNFAHNIVLHLNGYLIFYLYILFVHTHYYSKTISYDTKNYKHNIVNIVEHTKQE